MIVVLRKGYCLILETTGLKLVVKKFIDVFKEKNDHNISKAHIYFLKQVQLGNFVIYLGIIRKNESISMASWFIQCMIVCRCLYP